MKRIIPAILLALFFGVIIASFAHCQQPHWPDRTRLLALADSALIDKPATLAIAWQESADNLDPHLRGHHCWWSWRDGETMPRNVDLNPKWMRTGTDKKGAWLKYRDPNCEVGRFQIKPTTAKLRCPGMDVFTYDGNLWCFAHMFGDDTRTESRLYAIRHQNGAGDKTKPYVKDVLSTVGWLKETEE